MRLTIALIFIIHFWINPSLFSQEKVISADSVSVMVSGETVKSKKLSRFLVPKKAAMFSAAFPGLGQAYNRKYWKVPILYAGIGAAAYGIWWNNRYYNYYKNGYIDFRDSDPKSERYLQIPGAANYFNSKDLTSEDLRYLESFLQKRKDSYRRDRDLVIIVMVGVYVLNIIDANVDAHLSDFDISNDLSMRVAPAFFGNLNRAGNNGFGLSLHLNF